MNTKQKLEKRRDSKWRKEIPQPSYYDQDRYEDYCLGFNALAESWLEMYEAWSEIQCTCLLNDEEYNIIAECPMCRAKAKADALLGGES